jgi:ribose 5-phosphate isomerase B
MGPMKVAVGSDEKTSLTDEVARELERRGHELVLLGPLGGADLGWAAVGRALGELVADGRVDTGVLFCWTGTGASIAANKVRGVRAALCSDAATAQGARRWNDANVLVMSLRSTSPAVAEEMLDTWFATDPDPSERANVAALEDATG